MVKKTGKWHIIKFMNTLLLFPPQWTPISPHFALPSLLGQLKANGYEASGLDLNIDFYNKVLEPDFIKNAILKAVDNNQNILNEIAPYIKEGKDFSEYPLDIQNKIVRYTKIKEYTTKKQTALASIPDLAKEALNIIKGEDFYNPEMLIKSINIIDSALEMASLPYFPSKISLDNYSNPFFKLNFDCIKYFVFDKETNIFIEYYKTVLDDIKAKNADYIGISINSSSQIIPGLTLANILKNETNAHINIGGNFFGRVKEAVIKHPEFFDLFCDTILVEEGERPVVELAKYIKRTGIPHEGFSMKSILTGGEGLSDEDRHLLESVFGCTVYRRYSDMEMGILGQDTGGGSAYVLNWGSYYFECLKMDSDKPAESGEVGRIVVTDLFNYAFPMIRYDTGDIGVMEYGNTGEFPQLKEIYGRVRDCVYTVDGTLLSPAKISVMMWGIEGIKQWQFIQEDKNLYTLKLNSERPVLQQEYIEKFRSILGNKAQIQIELVDEIPIMASNKRRAVICNYQKE